MLVPAFAWLFHSQGFSPDILMQTAVGTSLSTIVVTGAASVRAHHRRGAVRWTVFRRFAPGFVVGALVGTLTVEMLASSTLQRVFGLFAVLVGVHIGSGRQPAPHRRLPNRTGLVLAGSVIGSISTVVGIGGGNLLVPFLLWCNTPVRIAIGTAAAAGLPIAAVGAALLMLGGIGEPGLPRWSTGFVYWPAFLGVAVMSAMFAPLGARLAHSIPTGTLKRGFGLFLCLVGVRMLLG